MSGASWPTSSTALTQARRDRSAAVAVAPPLVTWRISDRSGGTGAAGAETVPDSLRRCPRPVRLVGMLLDRATGEHLGEHRRDKPCGTKRCPVCGPELRRRYVAHFASTFAQLPAVYFATLTVDPKLGIVAEESRRYLLHAWSKFRKRLARAGALEFVAVPEMHASGYAHLHVLLSSAVVARELAGHWFAAGGGCVADFQAVPVADAARRAGYVMKYCLKDALGEHAGRVRSLLCSEGIGYHSAPARAAREALTGKREGAEPRAVGGLTLRYEREHGGSSGGLDLIEVWSTDQRNVGGAGAYTDRASADDLARWAALDRSRLTRAYRWKCPRCGGWYLVEMLPTVRGAFLERRTRLRGFRSVTDLPPAAAHRVPQS